MWTIRFTGAHDWPNAEIHSYDELEPLLDRWHAIQPSTSVSRSTHGQ